MATSQLKTAIAVDDSQFKQGMAECSAAANNFGKSMNSAGQKSQTFAGQLRTARKTALELAQAYDQLDNAAKNSDFGRSMKAQLDEAIRSAANLVDLKSDTMREINAVASDTFVWDAAKEGIGVVSSGLQGLASVYGLLGGDVQAFGKALVAVNAVQGVANTMITIGNALQHDSAIMTALRTAKNALFTTSETAATVATVANTAAETANTTATGANTTSKIANAAATGAQTAATNAATTSQLALNVAVLANPYVLAAAAIATLCAGIYFWVDSMNEATDSEAALTAATEAFNEEVDSTMKTVGEQISLYDDLKRQYDACGGKTDEFSKKLINNTDVQKKLGVVVKTVDDVHKLFAKNSDQYRRATLARASALAAETAQATMLGKTLAELSKIQAKLAAGEEVNWTDLKDVVKSAGYNDKTAQQIMIKAGFEIEGEFFGKDDVKKATGDFTKLITEMTKGGAYKALQDMADGFTAEFDKINDIDFNGLLTSSFDALEKIDYKADKSSKKSQKNAKNTKQEIEKVLTSLEGCDAIIQQAEKDMKALKSTSADYNKKLEKLKNTILMARIAKLQLLDNNTIDGLTQSKQLIEQIIKSLPQGHEKIEPLKKDLNEINEKIYQFYATSAKNGDLKSLGDARTQVENIIKDLPEGSAELVRWARIWREINDKILTAQQEVENLKNGIQKGSVTALEQELAHAKKMRDEWLMNNPSTLLLTVDQQEEIDALNEAVKLAEARLGNARITMKSHIDEPDNVDDIEGFGSIKMRPIDLTFEYKKQPLEKLEHQIGYIQDKINILKKVKLEDVGEIRFEEATQQLKDFEKQLKSLQAQAKLTELNEDIKEYTKSLREADYSAIQSGIDGLHTLYNVFSELPDRLDDCKNGFEGFFEVMEAGFSIVDAVVTFMDNIKKVSEVVTLLTGAKEALSVVNTKNAVTLGEEAAANQTLAASQLETTASQAANIPIATANAVANSNLATATLDLAASQIAAAHASIPFAGPALAAAGIATVTAAVAAAHAAMLGMQAFAEGGVVQGSHTMGDQLLVRANAGEMILNTRQQANLFDLLNSGTNETSSNAPTTTTFKIKGDTLYATLTNYMKITGKKL